MIESHVLSKFTSLHPVLEVREGSLTIDMEPFLAIFNGTNVCKD